MATIDVSELLTDPDFADAFSVTRNTQTMGDDGRATTVSASFAAQGSIQPASGVARKLLPEGVRVEGAIQIYTEFGLRSVLQNSSGDIITWDGQSYVVQTLNKYRNWGGGWCMAVCSLLDLVDADV